ncbi:hypothetical protein FD755_014441 [Muntiacus reevesi]|uniref:Xyloside xylosyltransferase 1 n=1 Tax=Muntiacus reevesi TaxID=9886 RepID=A0A5N3XLM0_MUNRE|nr:hypothetical protein FD755_014441 [Muntiacus reevesi]
MGLLRGGPPCARAMARLGAVRSHYCALLLAAALAVCAFYYLGSGRETFSSATKRLKEARAGAPAAPSPPVLELARGSLAPAPGAKAKSLEGGGAGPVDYHLLMMFTKAEHNAALQAKARVALGSLLRLAKFEAHEVLNLHFVSEEASREVAKALLRELLPPAAGFKCKLVVLFQAGLPGSACERLYLVSQLSHSVMSCSFCTLCAGCPSFLPGRLATRPENWGRPVPRPPQPSVPAFCQSIQAMPCPEQRSPVGRPTSHSEAPGLDSMVREAKNPGPGACGCRGLGVHCLSWGSFNLGPIPISLIAVSGGRAWQPVPGVP